MEVLVVFLIRPGGATRIEAIARSAPPSHSPAAGATSRTVASCLDVGNQFKMVPWLPTNAGPLQCSGPPTVGAASDVWRLCRYMC